MEIPDETEVGGTSSAAHRDRAVRRRSLAMCRGTTPTSPSTGSPSSSRAQVPIRLGERDRAVVPDRGAYGLRRGVVAGGSHLAIRRRRRARPDYVRW